MSLTKILETENYFKDLEPLTADLLYRTRSSYCYALITDSMYQIILQRNIFSEISSRSSYVVIKIPDQEDMLSPSQPIVQSFEEARRSGCRTYLIYMANGIQVERLLKYIDKYTLNGSPFLVFATLICELFFFPLKISIDQSIGSINHAS